MVVVLVRIGCLKTNDEVEKKEINLFEHQQPDMSGISK
jgi:hypothetical protein